MTDVERPIRILLVEDSRSTLQTFLKRVERIRGCESVPYTDPAELFADFPGVEFDIAIIDYMLPNHNGLEVIERLSSSPEHADKLFVIITAASERELHLSALEAGAIDFLRKPVDLVEFTARIRNMIRLRKAQIAMAEREALLRQEVDKATAELREREEEIIQRLTLAAGYRDDDTARHTKRVALYSGVIARRMGLPEEFCRDLELAAPMHDIGKVGIREAVLEKPGQLDTEEVVEMRRHTVIGAEIFQGAKSALMRMAKEVAEFHHERYDGSGYPAGLSGTDIPLSARIVAIADTFDALTTERPYKTAWPIDEAAAYIGSRAASQFDPDCVDAFTEASPEIFSICRDHVDFDGRE
ncbi:HD domain-containing phosphohydrolase [Oricola sp.]|uniref:HD domain-containing phosphohydrolase n=1 Tax=Oricola sp. TaxID=1979950 RepID=UPI0025E3198C|nr:HD domain-containing phosphohydrolase [Oricola sp.]MCI5078685.1 HD domain-containing protein [Oricola sp.]